MGILNEANSWGVILFGVLNAAAPLHDIARARRNRTAFRKLPFAVWSSLFASASLIVIGITTLSDTYGSPWDWILLPLWVAGLASVVITWRPRREEPDPPDITTVGLAQRINESTFGTTRLLPGYDQRQVDAFLDKLIAVLNDGGRLDPDELRDVRFETRRIRPGYHMEHVDDFLAVIAESAT